MSFFDDYISDIPAPAQGRVEAIVKVTGKGKYAAEYTAVNICYAVLVGSTVPSGIIKKINTDKAMQVAGVLDIITHTNKPAVPGFATEALIKESRFGLPVFHTDIIYFKNQPIALVIAETLEDATYAASIIDAEYETKSFVTDFKKERTKITLSGDGKERGNTTTWNNAAFTVENEYTIAAEVHNPMEMHATIAEWTATDKLKLYDKNQGVNNVQRVFANLFKIPADNIEVTSEFVGGGFGSGLRVWPHALAAVMAAKKINRPVKLMLTRPQMFTSVGYRPASWQDVKLGADKNGMFQGIIHKAMHSTSVYEKFNEGITRVTRLIYDIPNLKTESATVPLNLSTPTWMRGPGDCTGDFAVESSIDELSYKLKMDPVALRLKNMAKEKNPDNGLPWSTNYIDECIKKGAELIGWKSRPAKPLSIKDNEWYYGYGMAVGMWNAGRSKASAGIIFEKNGTLTVQTAMTDIGTGTGTGMLNMANKNTGLPKSKIKIELGNSNLPPAPSQGGSTGLSSISGAVDAVCNALKIKLTTYAASINPLYKNVKAEEIILTETAIHIKENSNSSVTYNDIWDKHNLTTIELEESSGPGAERQKYAFCSSAAHFCKLKVHRKTGKVKIEKYVVVADGGTIVNNKAAANQTSGACVGGIGMALMEEQHTDDKLGSVTSNDFAGYHFPVNADAPIIQVEFINKADVNINPSGAKGLGEVGIIGTAAAIANAIYNATCKRFRDLPITPDKILIAK